MFKFCLFIAASGYHVFGLPTNLFDTEDRMKAFGIRFLTVLATLFLLWLIGLKPVYLNAAICILLFDVAWLHYNHFDPVLLRESSKVLKTEIKSLELSTRESKEQLELSLVEKSKYETLNQQLTQSTLLLEDRQSEILNREENLDTKIDKLDIKLKEAVEIERIKLEGELSCKYEEKTKLFMAEMKENVDKRLLYEKSSIINNVFSFEEGKKDDFFELKQMQSKLNKREDELDKKSFLAEVEQRVSEASTYSLEAKHSLLSLKSENIEVRGEIKDLSHDMNNKLNEEKIDRMQEGVSLQHTLEKESWKRESAIKDVEYKVGELGHYLMSQLKDIEVNLSKELHQVSNTLSQIKLEFGQEILHLDSQNQTVFLEMDRLHLKNELFIQKAQQLTLDAKKQNLDGQQILQQVNTLYNTHKNEATLLEQRLEKSIDNIALKEGELAITLGESMLKLKDISNQQYIAMRDLSLEKKDINLLYREKNIEHDINIQQVRHAKQNLELAKEAFRNNKQSTLKNSKLTHRLFMNEQRYSQALFKERNSKGFLSRLAAHIEN